MKRENERERKRKKNFTVKILKIHKGKKNREESETIRDCVFDDFIRSYKQYGIIQCKVF
jgi:hypothetical protein